MFPHTPVLRRTTDLLGGQAFFNGEYTEEEEEEEEGEEEEEDVTSCLSVDGEETDDAPPMDDQDGIDLQNLESVDALKKAREGSLLRLKSTWSDIFERYGQDFEGVSDEVDLSTGKIVVDYGHVRRVQKQMVGRAGFTRQRKRRRTAREMLEARGMSPASDSPSCFRRLPRRNSRDDGPSTAEEDRSSISVVPDDRRYDGQSTAHSLQSPLSYLLAGQSERGKDEGSSSGNYTSSEDGESDGMADETGEEEANDDEEQCPPSSLPPPIWEPVPESDSSVGSVHRRLSHLTLPPTTYRASTPSPPPMAKRSRIDPLDETAPSTPTRMERWSQWAVAALRTPERPIPLPSSSAPIDTPSRNSASTRRLACTGDGGCGRAVCFACICNLDSD